MSLFNTLTFFANCEVGLPDIKPSSRVILNFDKDITEVEISYIYSFLKTRKILLKPADILDVSFDQDVYRSAGGAATGAIVGGLLTGGIGLLAGAALGGRRKKNNKIFLTINWEGMKYRAILVSKNSIQDIYDRLIKIMSLKPVENIIQRDKDVVGELKGLGELLDKGIITQEEFEVQKKKILA